MTCFAFVALAVALGEPGIFGHYKLSVGPTEDDLKAVVLTAEIPAIPDRFDLLLRPMAGGGRIPIQRETGGGKTRLFWIAGEMKKGSEAEWLLTLFTVRAEEKPRLYAQPLPDGTIEIGREGALFTRLVAGPSDRKPYLYPILLDGLHMTRRYPMEDSPGEDKDHVHQRSFWFTHGVVEGVDFWAEGPKSGTIRRTKVLAAEGGDVFARIATANEWLAPGGKKLLDDEREHIFYDLDPAGRMIDFTVKLTATDGPVTFGDTKEGTFGIRLAESMKEKRGGRIESSRGQVGMKNAWGKPAEWIDYTGKVGDRTVGVAIFDHPASFRHPTTWHVRDYGLFAANPFGLRDFTGDRSKDGSHRLAKGESMTFRYRVLLHPGSTAEAQVAAAYRAFAGPPAARVEKAEAKRE